MMRIRLTAVFVLSATLLQGCGGLPTAKSSDLSSLKLFGPNGQPRFAVYLTCAGLDSTSDAQCITVDNAFYEWSNDRHIKLRVVGKDDPAFQKGTAAIHSASDSAEPYLVTIRVEPAVEPSFRNVGNGVPSYGGIATHSGSVGYRAWIQIFSTVTGALIHQASPYDKRKMPDHTKNVTPTMRSQIDGLIRLVDPTYVN